MRNSLMSVGAWVCALVAALPASGVATGATEPSEGSPAGEFAPLVTAPRNGPGQLGGADDSYIVRLHDGADPAEVAADLGVAPEHTFTRVLRGFTAKLSGPALYQARANADVHSITQGRNYRVTPSRSEVRPPSWGLDRIDQKTLPLDGNYTTRNTGAGTTAYVIDSGIAPEHPDFEGRASIGFDATGGNGFDGNSHGTHVAGVIGGREHGVAEQIRLVGVKVLADNGTGSTGDILAGMEWVARNARGPSVVNISLAGPKDPTLNEAAHNLVTKTGVFVAAAAGDWREDAHEASPASTEGVFTVAASNQTDQAAQFSNNGATIEGFAPGVGITSTVPNGGVDTRTGTAVATAHVSGAAALFLQANPGANPSAIVDGLRSRASKGVIQNPPEETTSDLLRVAGL